MTTSNIKVSFQKNNLEHITSYSTKETLLEEKVASAIHYDIRLGKFLESKFISPQVRMECSKELFGLFKGTSLDTNNMHSMISRTYDDPPS